MAKKLGKHTPYFELVDAQQMAGCPICRLIYKTTDRYLDSILYEAVLDSDVREKLKSSQGFCQEHVSMMRSKPGRALGVALIYETILRHITELMEQGKLRRTGSLINRLKGSSYSGETLAEALTPQEACPACLIKQQATDNYLDLLTAYLDDKDFFQAYASGEGLCLPHLSEAVARIEDDDMLRRLLEPQIERYRIMLGDLAEYIRKRDHRFKMEKYGLEGDVWLRVMNAVVGGAGMGLSSEQGGHRDPNIGSRDR